MGDVYVFCFFAIGVNHILSFCLPHHSVNTSSSQQIPEVSVSEAHHCKTPGRCSHHCVPVQKVLTKVLTHQRPMSLQGFADAVCNSPQLRTRLLEGKPLLAWPKPSLVGVINKNSLSLNIEVMKILGDIWCPQWTGPITTPVAIQKQQAT